MFSDELTCQIVWFINKIKTGFDQKPSFFDCIRHLKNLLVVLVFIASSYVKTLKKPLWFLGELVFQSGLSKTFYVDSLKSVLNLQMTYIIIAHTYEQWDR